MCSFDITNDFIVDMNRDNAWLVYEQLKSSDKLFNYVKLSKFKNQMSLNENSKNIMKLFLPFCFSILNM